MLRFRVVLAASGAIACGGGSDPVSPPAPPPPPATPVASVVVQPDSVRIGPGASAQFSAQAYSASGSALQGRTISWHSTDPSIATVSSPGLVTALAYTGPETRVALAVAASEGKADTARITVAPVPVATIQVTAAPSTLVESDSSQLVAVTKDSVGGLLQGRPITWSSSDLAIATVSGSGRLIATPYAGDVLSRSVTLTASSEGKTTEWPVAVTVDLNRPATFFSEVPNAFPSLTSYFALTGPAASVATVISDLNRDGREDLVFHFWAGRWNWNPLWPTDQPTPNRLVALLANSDGTFSDATAQLFGSAHVDLAGSGSRKVRVADMNGDAYPDWVYAMNREDGRPYAPPYHHDAPNVAVLSNGNGTWRVVEFGRNTFHHSVDLLRAPDGWHVLTGDPGAWPESEVYLFTGGGFVPVSGYPQLSDETFVSYSTGTNAVADRLFTPVSSVWTEPSAPVIYSRSGGAWVEAGRFAWPLWRHVTGAGIAFPYWSVTWEGQDYIQGGWFESCSLRPTPGTDPVVIANYATSIVPGATPGSTTVTLSQMIPYSHLFGFRPGSGALQTVNVFSEPKGSYNSNVVDCIDINRDGHDDVVTAPMRMGGRPRVHLNNKSGTLVPVPETRFPMGVATNGAAGYFVDSNGDGIKDLLSMNSDCGGTGCQLRLFRGRRQLR